MTVLDRATDAEQEHVNGLHDDRAIRRLLPAGEGAGWQLGRMTRRIVCVGGRLAFDAGDVVLYRVDPRGRDGVSAYSVRNGRHTWIAVDDVEAYA